MHIIGLQTVVSFNNYTFRHQGAIHRESSVKVGFVKLNCSSGGIHTHTCARGNVVTGFVITFTYFILIWLLHIIYDVV